MEQTDYTCKDCFFFKNGACNHPNEIRFTSEENPSCTDFEYKEIKVELQNIVIMALPFGKTIKTRHFTVLKFSKSLSKKEVASLREDIPAEIKKHLQRGSLPFIKIANIAGTWGIEYSIGTSMYAALDECVPVAVGDHYEFSKDNGNIIEAFAQLMYADTSLPGDAEYTAGKLKLRDEYIAREAARRNAAADEGKTEEQLRKESDEAVQEVIDRDKHAETLLEMAEQIKKEGGKDE